jgi:antitoxin component HigA of HigAB toxin-antitoxin module
MDVRFIRNDDDHQAALAEIDALWNAPAGSEEAAKLDLLVTLVDAYEVRRWPVEDPDRDPVDVLHYAIDEMGHSQTELGEVIGSRSRASEILARRRALTVEMIYRISEAWKLPASLLVRPYAVTRGARRKRSAAVSRTSTRTPKPRRTRKVGSR